ncbi:pyocin knob domain-containing protein [Pectobacterium actinidiae]|uniref:Pyocin knob domain-containing protein n=1 Tax=Pectobacterium actinidiae TaxID=1507808 RepID=A0ABW8G8R3_9GAMM
MSWYKIGTIATTNGSKIITGTGTQFINSLNGVSSGRMLLLPAAGTVQIYEIESVQSDTQLTLVSPFSGTTGSGKSYAIPTSPSVSLEQFAHEFASTLSYYQQQLQGWQSILTGTGNITLTTPDGETVTVRSQAEWDALLNTKANAAQVSKKRGQLGTVNLNALTASSDGEWQQSDVGNATTANNYPVTAPGVLEVLPTLGGTSENCIQNFSASNSQYRYTRTYNAGAWSAWTYVIDSGTAQNVFGVKTFINGLIDNVSALGRSMSLPAVPLTAIAQLNNMTMGATLFVNGNTSTAALIPTGAASGFWHIRCVAKSDSTTNAGTFEAYQLGIAFNSYAGTLAANGTITWRRALYIGYTAIADANGFWKTSSPVISIFADGSFKTTDEAEGVSVERLSEGVYRIAGCQGMHSDAAWGGVDGGIANPTCRNGLERIWNDYEVHEDGSITVHTFHRVHPDAMPFAQNRLTRDKKRFDQEKGHTPDMEWPDQAPIDVPQDLFIQVRVNMPERDGQTGPVSELL